MADNIHQFQAGREAAMAGKPLDNRRAWDWREGWWQVTRQNNDIRTGGTGNG